MTLAELAAAAGVPARTIRFYISRGIVPGPLKAGRDAAYGPEHLERLEQVKELQGRGRVLSEIGRVLNESARSASLPAPTPWWQHAVAEDVVVLTKSDSPPWRLRQIRAALEEFAAACAGRAAPTEPGTPANNAPAPRGRQRS